MRHGLSCLEGCPRKLCQGFALDIFHYQKEFAMGCDNVERGHYVRMPNARGEASLVQKHRHEFGISRKLRMQSLDGNGARETDGT